MDNQTIPAIRVFHGLYNTAIFLLFTYHASVGLRIRRARLAGEADAAAMKTHRRNGPIFAVLGLFGYFAGITIALLDSGRILNYPPHFVLGTTIAALITAQYLVSRQIEQGQDVRSRHWKIGMTLLIVYLVQVLLGAGILISLRN